jgi:hypothetical protein
MDDTDAVFRGWATDADLTRFLTWRPHQRSEDTRAFLAGCVEAWGTNRRRAWALIRFDEDHVIGMIEMRIDATRAELGYVLARPAWGAGVHDLLRVVWRLRRQTHSPVRASCSFGWPWWPASKTRSPGWSAASSISTGALGRWAGRDIAQDMPVLFPGTI